MNRRQKKKMDKKREKRLYCIRGCKDYRGMRECKRFYNELATQEARKLGYHGKRRWKTIGKAYTDYIRAKRKLKEEEQ